MYDLDNAAVLIVEFPLMIQVLNCTFEVSSRSLDFPLRRRGNDVGFNGIVENLIE